MKRRAAVLGSVLSATLTLSACGGDNDGSAMSSATPVEDVPQPATPMAGPSEDPSAWKEVEYTDGLRFSVPASFEGPQTHEDWGSYTDSYDLNDASGSMEQRLMLGSLGTVGSADGARRVATNTNTLLIEGYEEIDRLSWTQDDNTAIERITFKWGDEASRAGTCWLLAGNGVVSLVTLYGSHFDDGLRNGVEESLTFVQEES